MKREIPDIPMILLAEPEETTRECIAMTLIDEGYDCHAVSNTKSFLQAIRIHNSDLVIADVRIINDNIQEIIEVQNHYPDFPSFLVTLNYEQIGTMLHLIKFKITEYLIKPFQFEELLERVQKLLVPSFTDHNE